MALIHSLNQIANGEKIDSSNYNKKIVAGEQYTSNEESIFTEKSQKEKEAYGQVPPEPMKSPKDGLEPSGLDFDSCCPDPVAPPPEMPMEIEEEALFDENRNQELIAMANLAAVRSVSNIFNQVEENE